MFHLCLHLKETVSPITACQNKWAMKEHILFFTGCASSGFSRTHSEKVIPCLWIQTAFIVSEQSNDFLNGRWRLHSGVLSVCFYVFSDILAASASMFAYECHPPGRGQDVPCRVTDLSPSSSPTVPSGRATHPEGMKAGGCPSFER